ncbi:heterokaryon incompatibility protein-domain-containing protein [Xylariales sp. PMI_506]|nr:heterokaryon incompatibility protein-domain-containing protein [Xylariales sp. PMI_506]
MVCVGCLHDIFEKSQQHGVFLLSHLTDDDGSDRDACTICSRLRQDIKTYRKTRPLTSQTPVYWWTVRRGTQLREGHDYYTITFRPYLEVFLSHNPPPQRSFHLFIDGTVSIVSELGNGTDSVTSMQQVLRWIKNCDNTHEQCKVSEVPDQFPNRLLSIGRNAGDRIFVLETHDPSFVRDKYVTLSHCWGDPRKGEELGFKLSPHTIGDFTSFKTGIEFTEMPKNFQEAVRIARSIGVQYIWIDALCILQDDKEFLTEGHLMQRVYRNSFCNMAAVASENSKGGFFRARINTSKIIPQTVEVPSTSGIWAGRKWRIMPSDGWADKLLNQVLYHRGWVFQERILSPRILHFSEEQIFWDCATLSACETFPDRLPEPLDGLAATERHWRERLQAVQKVQKVQPHSGADRGGDTRNHMSYYPVSFSGSANDSIETFWRRAIRDYTACELTKQEDRLAAIWGVAKHVRDQMRHDLGSAEEYGAGLWSSNLEEQLAWRVLPDSSGGSAPRCERRPATLCRLFPSWSWASVVGQIDLRDRYSGEFGRWVTNHEGGDVAFSLENYDGLDDFHPVLRTHELAVKGNLISARIVIAAEITEPATMGGRLSMQLTANEHSELQVSSDSFELLPDTTDDLGSCYLLILADSRDNRKQPEKHEADDEDDGSDDDDEEVDEDDDDNNDEADGSSIPEQCSESAEHSQGEPDMDTNSMSGNGAEEVSCINENERSGDEASVVDDEKAEFEIGTQSEWPPEEVLQINGIGIMLQDAEDHQNTGKRRFQRIGMFQFENIPLEDYKKLNPATGENFWLI